MFKLGAGLVGLIVVAAVWHTRQRSMKQRLQGFDDGTLCIACHSRNMTVTGTHAVCGDCFHRADLTVMRGSQFSEQQIKDMTRPQ
jgi:hypothetical protein